MKTSSHDRNFNDISAFQLMFNIAKRLILARSVVYLFTLVSALIGLVKIAAAQAESLVITHVTVINPGLPTQSNMTVLIREGKIFQVGESHVVKLPPSAKVIDGTGKFVLSGIQLT